MNKKKSENECLPQIERSTFPPSMKIDDSRPRYIECFRIHKLGEIFEQESIAHFFIRSIFK